MTRSPAPAEVSETPDRLLALDSLRGIAAFIVMLGHCLMIPAGDPPVWITQTPLRLLINGHAAVIIFLVLSGYVLSIPFWRGAPPAYPVFLLRRTCRIFLPFAAGVLFAALLYLATPTAEPGLGSAWFHFNWASKPVTPQVLAEHLLMTGRAQDMWLNPIMWSLVYEMRISLVFPLLMLACRRTLPGALFAAAAFVAGALATAALDAPSTLFAYHLLPTLTLTLYYAAYFLLGALLAKTHGALAARLKGLPAAGVAALFVLALTLLDLPKAVDLYLPAADLPLASATEGWLLFAPEALLGVGAGLLIVLARCFGSRRTPLNPLRLPAMVWLGKVSYSLYLVHYPIAFFLGRRLLGEVPFPFLVLVIVSASLVVSALFHGLIERPSMALSRIRHSRAALSV